MKSRVGLIVLLVFLAGGAGAGRVYEDDFSGNRADYLNGTAPDIRPGSEVWLNATRSMDLKADGYFNNDSNSFSTAALPFTLAENRVYTFSVDLNMIGSRNPSNSDWAAMSMGNTVNTGSHPLDSTYAALLIRRNGGALARGGGDTAVSAGTYSGMVNLSIVLDTTAGSWTQEAFINGFSVGGAKSISAQALGTSYLKIGHYRTFGEAAFDNLSLDVATSWIPSPSGDFYPSEAQIQAVSNALPATPYVPAPPVSDRGFWSGLSSSDIIAKAESVNAASLVVITDEDYLYYCLTGDRSVFTSLRVERRDNLKALVLAECMEDAGRFLGKIEDYIESYCVMPSWMDSAHDSAQKTFYGELTEIDLFAAENAMLLSATYSLLEARLSSGIKTQLKGNIRQRIIDPWLETCRAEVFPGIFWWIKRDSNWNSYCTAGVLYSTLIMSDSQGERAEAVACALSSLGYYLDAFSADGYNEEGIEYWQGGFGAFMRAGEVLMDYTAGAVGVFESPNVQAAGHLPVELELVDNLYPAYGDSTVVSVALSIQLAVARNFGIPYTGGEYDPLTGSFEEILLNITHPEVVSVPIDPVPQPTSWFDIADVLVSRGTSIINRFHTSIKVGGNGDDHGHNDVGSYVVLLDGMFASVDPGRGPYTADTFGDERYTSDLLNSRGHSVPLVADQLQSYGSQYRGTVLNHSFSAEKDTLQIDLSGAYVVPSLQMLQRDFEFNRAEDTVTVTDSVQFSMPQNFGTAIITFEDYTIISPREIHISRGGTLVKITLSSTGGQLAITPEIIDEGSMPVRLGINFVDPVTSGSIEVKYEQVQYSTAAYYEEDFAGNRTTLLNGIVPDTRPGGEVWESSDRGIISDLKEDGYFEGYGTGYGSAALPFNLESNKVYTFSADLVMGDLVEGNGDWAAISFGSATDPNSSPVTSAFSYLLLRRTGGARASNSGWAFDTAAGLYSNTVSLSITLNTTGADWFANYEVNGTSIGSDSFAAGTTGIKYIKIGHYRDFGAAQFKNLSLAYSFIPSYGSWIEMYPGAGAESEMGDDPDKDGMDNLAEWALGGNPADVGDRGHPPMTRAVESGGTNWFIYIHAQRADAESLGLVYTVEASTNLTTGTWSTNGILSIGSGTLDAEFDVVTNRVSMELDTKKFLHLKIEAN